MKTPGWLFLLGLMLVAALVLSQAGRGTAAPAAQETQYPYPTVTLASYPEPQSETPVLPTAPGGTPAVPATATATFATPPAAQTVSPQARTPGRDLFGTEEAEIGIARLTPAPSPTPSPSPSPTLQPTPPPPPEPGRGFLMQPAWFAIGVLTPLVFFTVFLLLKRARHSGEFS